MNPEVWDENEDEPSILDLSEPSVSSKSSSYSRNSLYHCAQSYLLPRGDHQPPDNHANGVVYLQRRPIVIKVDQPSEHKRAIKNNFSRCYHASCTKLLSFKS
ncbi:unnamed protein product [Calicophoron daubneyi]|uniref:Uncharacterized protein n=1 Tax=Calicophoron daubneyi TaxID=300641 RepID=A0AAV2T7D6_CALDB